jgi:hypothetical protein
VTGAAVALTTYLELAEPRGYEPAWIARTARSFPNVVHAGQSSPNSVYSLTSTSKPLEFKSGTTGVEDKALVRLRSFKKWRKNWDGEGAPAPKATAIEAAIALLSLLQNTYHSFAVHLDGHARPVFFLRQSDWEGEITVEDAHHVSFDFRLGSDVHSDFEVAFDGEELPQSLIEAIALV